jgi:hypothetical protein
VNTQESASKFLCVNLAALFDLFIKPLVTVALTFSLKPVLQGLRVSLLVTQSKASLVHDLYLAENRLITARTTSATKHADITNTLNTNFERLEYKPFH